MADVLYKVRTVYETDTGPAQGALRGLAGRTEALGGALGRLRGLLGLALGAGAAAAIGGTLGALALLHRGITDLNAVSESTAVGIAGMVQAARVEGTEGPGGWGRSMEFAQQALAGIRRDAAALPGEAEDFVEVFRAGLAPALDAGMRAADVAQLTNRFAAVGISFRVDAPQIGRDLNLMLQGRAGAHVNMWNRLKSSIGLTAEEFNRLSAAERQLRIDTALRRYQPMIDAYQGTWEAVSSTTRSYGKEVLRVFSRPVFELFKRGLADINTRFARSEERIQDIVYGIGTRLAAAFDAAGSRAQALFDRLDRWAHSPGSARILAIGDRLVSGASSAVRSVVSSAAAHPTGTAALAGAAMGVPGMGLIVGALAQFATHTNEVNAVFSFLGAIGRNLVGVLDPLAQMFDAVAVQGGILLAAFLPPFMAGLDGLTNGLMSFIRQIGPAVGELLSALSPIIEIVGGVLGEFARFIGTEIRDKFSELGTALSAMLSATARFIRWANQKLGIEEGGGWRNNIGRFDSLLGAGIMTLVDSSLGRGRHFSNRDPLQDEWRAGFRANLYSQYMRHGITDGRDAPRAQRADQNGSQQRPTETLASRIAAGLAALRRPFTEGQGQASLGGRRGLMARTASRGERPVVNVTIQQTINAADDPDRVLIMTRRALMDALYAPLESAGARVTR